VRSGSSGPSGVVKAADAATTGTKNVTISNAQLTKWGLPIGAVLLLVGCSLAGLGTWYVFLFDGPENDRGRQIDHWRYSYHLTQGSQMIDAGRYKEAGVELQQAQVIASTLGDNYGRLMNVYRAELNLYAKSSDFKSQSDVVKAMSRVTWLRAHKDFDIAIKELNSIDKILNSKDGDSHLSHIGLEMRLSAIIGGIREIAQRLSATGDYDHQEELLSHTVNTYSRLVGDDDPQLAALELDLAESHVSQDEFDEARQFFKNSLAMFCKARANNRIGVTDLDVAKIWLRIGQFDRDRSDFKDSETELNTAFNMLKGYSSETLAVQDDGRGIKLLIECDYALADYAKQTKDLAAAKKYRMQAQAMKELKRKLRIGRND
jgi:tetratricopeptide (TPR) repeat protein